MRRTDIVQRALRLLGELARQRPSRDLYEPAVDMREHYWRMIALGYYRNKLLHVFAEEGLWACALYAAQRSSTAASSATANGGSGGGAEGTGAPSSGWNAGSGAQAASSKGDGAKLSAVWSCVEFLASLMAREFVSGAPTRTHAHLAASLAESVRRGTFELGPEAASGREEDRTLHVAPEGTRTWLC